ncbi:hypothetical protein KSP40_PGU017722 [Platanthera guangdongensis]|uniref:Uncharacterized protein n=1 Tax=Platanthera guangdongensis TaxID=2320717 RepID=A0ABR2LSM2_9ASPA
MMPTTPKMRRAKASAISLTGGWLRPTMTAETTTTKPILPTASPRPSRRFSNRHRHHGRIAAASALAVLSLFIALAAWFSLVYDPSHRFGLRRFRAWDSPIPSHWPRIPPPLKPDASFPSENPNCSSSSSPQLSLRHTVFGIAGSANLWPRRREFIRLCKLSSKQPWPPPPWPTISPRASRASPPKLRPSFTSHASWRALPIAEPSPGSSLLWSRSPFG